MNIKNKENILKKSKRNIINTINTNHYCKEKTRETWFVPELVEKVNRGEITIETYIKTLKHCGVSMIFPSDTKMEISIQEDSITLDANEKKLFKILQKANGCVKVTLISSKEDIWIELIYYKK